MSAFGNLPETPVNRIASDRAQLNMG